MAGEYKRLQFSDGVETAKPANLSTIFYFEDTSAWDGAESSITYDVSAFTDDAKRMVWQFKDIPANDYEILAPEISHPTATTVKVSFGFAIPAGTYTLVGR